MLAKERKAQAAKQQRTRLQRTGSLIELRGAGGGPRPLPAADAAVPIHKRIPSDEEACVVFGLARGARESITFEEYVRAMCSFPGEAEAEAAAAGSQTPVGLTVDSAGLASPLRTRAPRAVQQFRKLERQGSSSMLSSSPAHSLGTPTVDELNESSFED